jgi:hypothetical protein
MTDRLAAPIIRATETVLQFRSFEAPRVSIKLGLLQPGAAAQAIRPLSTIRPFL